MRDALAATLGLGGGGAVAGELARGADFGAALDLGG